MDESDIIITHLSNVRPAFKYYLARLKPASAVASTGGSDITAPSVCVSLLLLIIITCANSLFFFFLSAFGALTPLLVSDDDEMSKVIA